MVEETAPVLERLASFAAQTRLADLPDDVVYHAKLTILDTLGVAIAAGRHAGGREVVSYVRASSGDRTPGAAAAIWGQGFRAAAPDAAYANGYLANSLDFDEGWHLGTIIIPAVVALAEVVPGASGADLLTAYVTGREVGDRIRVVVEMGRDTGTGPTRQGWWHPGLVGPIAAAVGCARLLGLPAAQIADAASAAACSSGGFRQAMGSMAKALHSANAARDALHVARLAQAGFTADHRILEGHVGFLSALGLPEDSFLQVLDTLGSRYDLQPPPRFKLFPVCGAGQADTGAVLAWRVSQSPERIAHIARVQVDFHGFSMFRTAARDDVEVGFSMPYIVAACLVDGAFGLAQLGDGRVHDPAIRSLMDRVVDRRATADAVAVVEFDDGSQEAIPPAGWPAWTEQAITDKFRACAAEAISAEAAGAVIDAVFSLEEQRSVDLLAELVCGPSHDVG